MIRLLADENIPPVLIAALIRAEPILDIVTVQFEGLADESDPVVLAAAALSERVLLTYDHRTIPKFASDRVTEGQPMPGVIVLHSGATLQQLIAELRLALKCLSAEEFRLLQILHLPL